MEAVWRLAPEDIVLDAEVGGKELRSALILFLRLAVLMGCVAAAAVLMKHHDITMIVATVALLLGFYIYGMQSTGARKRAAQLSFQIHSLRSRGSIEIQSYSADNLAKVNEINRKIHGLEVNMAPAMMAAILVVLCLPLLGLVDAKVAQGVASALFIPIYAVILYDAKLRFGYARLLHRIRGPLKADE